MSSGHGNAGSHGAGSPGDPTPGIDHGVDRSGSVGPELHASHGPHRPDTFMGDFRRFFGRGLAILLPSILTLWILWQLAVFLFQNVAEPINATTRQGVLLIVPYVWDEQDLPEWFTVSNAQVVRYRAENEGGIPLSTEQIRQRVRSENLREYWRQHWYLNLTGLALAILLIYLAGLLLGNFFGRALYTRVERLIARIPGFKQIYPHVKQLVDLILGEQKMAFRRVVLFEYPRKGIWTLGFVTGSSFRQIHGIAGGEVVSVFVPTSPTPFTGFTINMLAEHVHELDVSIDQALRFVITAGVLGGDEPPERAAPAAVTAARAAEARETAQRRITGLPDTGGTAPEGDDDRGSFGT